MIPELLAERGNSKFTWYEGESAKFLPGKTSGRYNWDREEEVYYCTVDNTKKQGQAVIDSILRHDTSAPDQKDE